MPRKLILSFVALALSGVGWQTASAGDLGYYGREGGIGTHYGLGFDGQAFPYGYRWSYVRACTRYVLVETRNGERRERVWVCDRRR